MEFSGACAHATVHAAVVHKYTQNACYSLQALQALTSLPQLYGPCPVTAFICIRLHLRTCQQNIMQSKHHERRLVVHKQPAEMRLLVPAAACLHALRPR